MTSASSEIVCQWERSLASDLASASELEDPQLEIVTGRSKVDIRLSIRQVGSFAFSAEYAEISEGLLCFVANEIGTIVLQDAQVAWPHCPHDQSLMNATLSANDELCRWQCESGEHLFEVGSLANESENALKPSPQDPTTR